MTTEVPPRPTDAAMQVVSHDVIELLSQTRVTSSDRAVPLLQPHPEVEDIRTSTEVLGVPPTRL
jgi:hypothetical protein